MTTTSLRERVGCTCDRVHFIIENEVRVGVYSYHQSDTCGHCYSFHTNQTVNELRGGDGHILPIRTRPHTPGGIQTRNPLPVLKTPCRYQGGLLSRCTSCNSQAAEGKHVYQCLHPSGDYERVTRGPISPHAHSCRTCEDYELPELPSSVHNTPLSDRYPTPSPDRQSYLLSLREIIGNPPLDPGGGHDDGILYVGGGPYWIGIVIGCRLLRELGCTLPIQVWYRGSCEPVDPTDVEGLDVELIDADAVAERLGDTRIPRGNIGQGGWESKLYAIAHCPFDRLLYLDADAYCVSDPTPMFSVLDQSPFVYWKDLPGNDRTVKWHELGIPPTGKPPQVQGGQLFISRKDRGWNLIAAAAWMCEHSDYYFGKMFGDQDTWRVALQAGASTYTCLGNADWDDTSFVCRWNSQPMIVHRCRGKLYDPEDIPIGKTGYSNPRYQLPLEGRVFDILASVLNRRTIDPSSRFSTIYERRIWGGGSGSGSSEGESKPYIEIIKELSEKEGWTSCVDIGCGDGMIARQLTFPIYQGYDVTPKALSLFQRNYPAGRWSLLDATKSPELIAPADVLLCKDVLHHLPNSVITQLLTRLIELRRWKCLVLTQDVHQRHDEQDCYLGGYRALHPFLNPLEPFGLEIHKTYLHKAVLVKHLSTS